MDSISTNFTEEYNYQDNGIIINYALEIRANFWPFHSVFVCCEQFGLGTRLALGLFKGKHLCGRRFQFTTLKHLSASAKVKPPLTIKKIYDLVSCDFVNIIIAP